MSDIFLEGPEPAAPEPAPAPAAEPVAEPIAAAPEPEPEPAAEPEPAPEPAAAPAAEPKAAKGSMLQDLIAARKEAKEAKQALQTLQPVLSRMTPEVAQAIKEGRVVIKPQQSQPEAERARLEQVATDLGLFKADNTPDTEAAERVSRYVRSEVNQRVAPVERVTLEDKANKTIAAVWTNHAKGLSEDALAIVREEFDAAMAMPNAAQALSQPEIAETVMQRALGRAYTMGKLTGTPAPAPAKKQTPAAIITEPGGRRAPSAAAITLTPTQQAVYRNHGLDPSKASSATTPPQVDARGSMSLE
jgi:hypothetical protein